MNAIQVNFDVLDSLELKDLERTDEIVRHLSAYVDALRGIAYWRHHAGSAPILLKKYRARAANTRAIASLLILRGEADSLMRGV